jgi:hypothetical protein
VAMPPPGLTAARLAAARSPASPSAVSLLAQVSTRMPRRRDRKPRINSGQMASKS